MPRPLNGLTLGLAAAPEGWQTLDAMLEGAATSRPSPPVDVPSEEQLFAIVRAGFAQRRKMLRSALRPMFGPRTESVLTAAGVRPDARAETLGLDEWAALAREAA